MNHLLNLAVVEKNHAALVNQKCLIIHTYLQDSAGKSFAEQYASDIEVTYGGNRTTGTAARGSDGTITFTPDSD